MLGLVDAKTFLENAGYMPCIYVLEDELCVIFQWCGMKRSYRRALKRSRHGGERNAERGSGPKTERKNLVRCRVSRVL